MDELDDPGPPLATVDVALEGDVLVVTFTGEIDMSNVELLHGAIAPALAEDPREIVFDVAALEFMDSSGIALLLRMSAAAETVRLRGPSPIVRRLIAATGLTDVLCIEP